MILGKLSDWPSAKKTKWLLIISIILIVIVYPFMAYFTMASKYPVDFMTSQLSFSSATLKAHYAVTVIDFYRVTQSLDYIFMLGYGMLAFSLGLIIGRKFEEDSKWRTSGYIISIFGIIAASCDAIENGFILAMLTDPFGFPDIWAVTHSVFALIKYILLISCIGWAIVASVLRIIKK